MTDRQQDPLESSAALPTQQDAGDAAPTAEPATEPQPRQAPQYGELAPEGWSWTPEHGEGTGAATQAAAGVGQGAHTPAPSTGRVPGVPHNLGAGRTDPPGSQPNATAAAPAPVRTPEPPRSDAAVQPDPVPETQLHYRGTSQPGPQGARRGDRVVTIVLLVIGAFGALYFAASMQQLPASLEMLAGVLQVDGFTVPEAVRILGTVGALLVLVLYALNLILSIHRMRHGKLAFWVPLAAAGIAFVVVFAFSAFALNQTPELVKVLSDPAATEKLIEYLGNAGATTTP